MEPAELLRHGSEGIPARGLILKMPPLSFFLLFHGGSQWIIVI